MLVSTHVSRTIDLTLGLREEKGSLARVKGAQKALEDLFQSIVNSVLYGLRNFVFGDLDSLFIPGYPIHKAIRIGRAGVSVIVKQCIERS